MTTYIALAHARRLSLVLGPRSFRLGFEPLSEASLSALRLQALFLVVLTTAACLREFWALSRVLPFPGSDPCLACVPLLEAPSESLTHSIPRSFLVESLSAFAEGLAAALLLCPEHALRLFFASVSFVDPVRIVASLAPCLRCW